MYYIYLPVTVRENLRPELNAIIHLIVSTHNMCFTYIKAIYKSICIKHRYICNIFVKKKINEEKKKKRNTTWKVFYWLSDVEQYYTTTQTA